jgi:hypothetical protein
MVTVPWIVAMMCGGSFLGWLARAIENGDRVS